MPHWLPRRGDSRLSTQSGTICPFIDPEREVVFVSTIGRVRLVTDKLPLVLGDGRKKGVAVDVGVYARQVQSLCHGQEKSIDLAATDHHNFTDIASLDDCFVR